MKKSAILDIFNGTRGKRDRLNISKECEENLRISCKAYDELREKLSPELIELHNKHIEAVETAGARKLTIISSKVLSLDCLSALNVWKKANHHYSKLTSRF